MGLRRECAFQQPMGLRLKTTSPWDCGSALIASWDWGSPWVCSWDSASRFVGLGLTAGESVVSLFASFCNCGSIRPSGATEAHYCPGIVVVFTGTIGP